MHRHSLPLADGGSDSLAAQVFLEVCKDFPGAEHAAADGWGIAGFYIGMVTLDKNPVERLRCDLLGHAAGLGPAGRLIEYITREMDGSKSFMLLVKCGYVEIIHDSDRHNLRYRWLAIAAGLRRMDSAVPDITDSAQPAALAV